MPIEMDGVPGISQPEVQPELGVCLRFMLPDSKHWYHPRGCGSTDPALGYRARCWWRIKENIGYRTVGVVLNDIDVADAWLSGVARLPENRGDGVRRGPILSGCGKSNARISARAGAPQRWRIVNTAKSRYFNIDFREGTAVFTKIGGDGGLLEYPTPLQTIVLGAGERADVIVTPKGKPGSEIQVTSGVCSIAAGSVEF